MIPKSAEPKPDRIVRCAAEPTKAAPVGFCDCVPCCQKRLRDWRKLCALATEGIAPEAVPS